MKFKILFVVLIAVVLVPGLTYEAKSQKTALKGVGKYEYALFLDPFEFLISRVLNVGGELRIMPKNSITGFLSYYNFNEQWKGYGVGASYRFYLQLFGDRSRAIEGFFVGPMVKFSFWDSKFLILGEEASGSLFVAGAEFGYKWIPQNSGFIVEPIFRLGLPILEVESLSYSPEFAYGVNFGYAWGGDGI